MPLSITLLGLLTFAVVWIIPIGVAICDREFPGNELGFAVDVTRLLVAAAC
jgi:hypothetical protein